MLPKDISCFGSTSGDLILVANITTDKDIEGDWVVLKV